MNNISPSHKIQWEQIIVAVVSLSIFLLLTILICNINFASESNHFVLLIVINFAVILILTTATFVKKNENLEGLTSISHIILMLGGAGLFVTIYGYFVELYGAAIGGLYSGLFGVITTEMTENNSIFFVGVERVMKSSSMAVVGIYVCIITALIWFALQSKINHFENDSASLGN